MGWHGLFTDYGSRFLWRNTVAKLKNRHIMKSKYEFFSFLAVCIFTVSVLSSCSKMNDLHDEYLKRGEQIYVGQPDSAKIFPGNERALLRYWTSDPKASKLLVYWNARQDSLLLDI